MNGQKLIALIIIVVALAIPGQSCNSYSKQQSEETAREFVKNSPTFEYDGIEDTLKLTEDEKSEDKYGWKFTYEFSSRHAGYGDRSGQVLAQVITSHEATITVEDGAVVKAVLDEKWDMISQTMVSESG
jgi:hypothetical protein